MPLVCKLSCKDVFLTKSVPITRNHVYFLGAAWQVYSGSSRREGQDDSYVSHQPLATLSILPYLLPETLLPPGLMLNFWAAFLLQQMLILQEYQTSLMISYQTRGMTSVCNMCVSRRHLLFNKDQGETAGSTRAEGTQSLHQRYPSSLSLRDWYLAMDQNLP